MRVALVEGFSPSPPLKNFVGNKNYKKFNLHFFTRNKISPDKINGILFKY